MVPFLVRRTFRLLLVLLGVSLFTFGLWRLAPGDPAAALLGPYATPETLAPLRSSLGLDRPLYVQYGLWLNKILHGDFGTSIALSMPVGQVIWPKLAASGILAFTSFLLATVIGVGVGLVTSSKLLPASMRKALFFVLMFLGNLPVFWLGILMVLVFSLTLNVLPSQGMYDVREPGGLPDLLRHLVLPALTAALPVIAVVANTTAAAVEEHSLADFARTARSKGLHESRILLKHVLRVVAPGIVTVLGLQIGFLVGGSLYTEVVFSWPGLGMQLYSSVAARDLPVIQAATLIIAAIFVVSNLIADAFSAVLDPRLKV